MLEGIIHVADLGLSVTALTMRYTPVPGLVCVTFQSQIIEFAILEDHRIPCYGIFNYMELDVKFFFIFTYSL